MFPMNAWYVACFADELADKPLGRRICGEAMVFFRPAPGEIAALEDFCPHRGAPLSLGTVVDGRLQCGYHGLQMGCEGKTVAMPGQRVGGFPPIRKFAAVERDGFVWVWPGDAAKADPSAIHSLAWAQSDEWAFGGGMFPVACDYRLMIDNLMDLTHETYVHADSIGQKEIDESPPVTAGTGDEVTVTRLMHGISAPPFWRMALRGNHLADDVPVDRWQICRFFPPSHVMIDVGVAHAGKGGFEAAAEHKVGSVVVDFITPETDSSIWYFWGMARHFNPKDEALTASIREGQATIFAQDIEMLERQQRNIAAHPQRKLLGLNIDAGGVRARKVLDRLMQEERGAAG